MVFEKLIRYIPQVNHKQLLGNFYGRTKVKKSVDISLKYIILELQAAKNNIVVKICSWKKQRGGGGKGSKKQGVLPLVLMVKICSWDIRGLNNPLNIRDLFLEYQGCVHCIDLLGLVDPRSEMISSFPLLRSVFLEVGSMFITQVLMLLPGLFQLGILRSWLAKKEKQGDS